MKTIFIIFTVILLNVSRTIGQEKAQIFKELKKILYYDVNLNLDKHPGLVITTFVNDSIFTFPFGSLQMDNAQKIDTKSQFGIGKLGTIFISDLVRILEEKGLFDPTKEINDYLPTPYQNSTCKGITIADILSHQSGLPKLMPDYKLISKTPNFPFSSISKKQVLQSFADYEIKKEQSQYEFSPFGFAILEIILEGHFRKNLSSILDEHLFKPLQMGNTNSFPNLYNFAIGHDLSNNPIPTGKMSSFKHTYGIYSNTEDLIKYLKAHIYSNPFKNIFSKNYSELFPSKKQKNTYIGYGWHIFKPKKNVKMVVHTSIYNGTWIYMCFVPDSKTGVIIMSNSSKRLYGLGYQTIKMLNHNWKNKNLKKWQK